MPRCRGRRRRQGRYPGAGTNQGVTSFEELMCLFRKMIQYDPVRGTEDPDDDPDMTDKDKANILKVKKVDLDIKANTKAHHTDEYDIADAEAYNDTELLVIRRGQQFNIKILFNRSYDESKDDLRLIFEFGNNPLPSKGSRVEFILSDKDLPNEWGAWITKKDGQSLTVAVTTPPTCAVAKWTLKVDVVKKTDTKTKVYRYNHKDPLYILFNPWCKDDQVYLENDKDEYVLNESGIVYKGSKYWVSGAPWNFGQFSECVLPCVMELLDEKSNIQDAARGDAVKVTRQLTSLVNGFDNDGVLAGNWSGDYEGGTSPLKWTGSVAILEEFSKTKQTVNYGQCWVFSGVLTTVCRTLGIPARSVTNFASAHDTDASCTIDKYFTTDGEVHPDTSDSVWNFHVWNEAWMCRRDLPKEFSGSGWQIIDATPQEKSDGYFCMGPCPIEAIKKGVVYLPYDGAFAFAEVNADIVSWEIDENGGTKVLSISKYSVGKKMSTKKPGSGEREDITHRYKFSEGTTDERAAVRMANLHSSKKVYENKEGDVKFSLEFNDNTFVGDPIKLDVKLVNTSNDTRTVSGSVKLASSYYTGEFHKTLQKQDFKDLVLKAKEEKCISSEVTADKYLDKLVDHFGLLMTLVCKVKETGQIFSDIDDRRLRKPHLTIKAPEKGSVGKKFEAEVSFVNPLPVPLTKCELHVEGPGLQKTARFKQKDVKTKETFTAKLEFTPVKAGKKEVIAAFSSTELAAVFVSATVQISK